MNFSKETLASCERDFLEKVRQAINRPAEYTPHPKDVLTSHETDASRQTLARILNRTAKERLEILKHLKESAKTINLQVWEVKNLDEAARAVERLTQEREPEWGKDKSISAWRHPLVDALDLGSLLKGIPVHVAEIAETDNTARARFSIRQKVSFSFMGITSADFCVAESATLVMKTRPGQARMVSLLPSIHVAVIRENQIIENFKELYTLLSLDLQESETTGGLTHCMTFISGPSKTADIEAHMVYGAHGPREMILIVIVD